jgi:tetratricopeptide (TPR) repeat protein
MRPRHVAFALALALGAIGGLGACHAKQEMTPPPPPLRPDPEPVSDTPKASAQTDCEPTDADHELKSMPFDERSIPEGEKLAEQGKSELKTAESAEVDRPTREGYITQAVDDFTVALRADPYNVTATYNLAAAYARIGRNQCALNLLTRILQMRAHASKRAEVELHLDRLLGRKGTLDPDFSGMRKDDRFRQLIAKMCEGTNDANCVYGGQTSGRER